MGFLNKDNTIATVNFSPNFNFVEFIVYDLKNARLLCLDHEPFHYVDNQTREMEEDTEALKQFIKRLYERNNIPMGTPTTLVMPSFLTREMVPPEGLDIGDLSMFVLSQVESFYIFKKLEPVVGFSFIDEKKILYTAYPKLNYLPLEQAFEDLKIPLAVTECHYTATLRGLIQLGAIHEEIESGLTWLMIVLGETGAGFFMMNGARIEKMQESPISVEMDDESILAQFKDDFVQFCQYEIINRVIVVDNTKRFIEAQIKEAIGFDNTVIFEQNSETLESLGAYESKYPCSLEAIGGIFSTKDSVTPKLDFIQNNIYESAESQRKKDLVGFGLIGIGALLLVGQLLISFGMDFMGNVQSEKAIQLQGDIQNMKPPEAQYLKLKEVLFDQRSYNYNVGLYNVLVQTFQTLPPDAWLTSLTYESQDNFRLYNVDIKGAAQTAGNLGTYLQEVNTQLTGQSITPTVTPKQSPLQQQYFEFSLTTQQAQQPAH